jgi:hypothetical protein
MKTTIFVAVITAIAIVDVIFHLENSHTNKALLDTCIEGNSININGKIYQCIWTNSDTYEGKL